MPSSRYPKHPYGEHCNLRATLNVIFNLPDEQVIAWGEAFDWSQPVEIVSVSKKEPGVSSVETLSAADVLLDMKNSRLNDLLLRPSMFALVKYRRDNSLANLVGDSNDNLSRKFSSEASLLCSAFDRAMCLSDLKSASRLAGWLSSPEHANIMTWHMVQLASVNTPRGLFLNKQSTAQLEETLDYCEELVVRDARVFRMPNDKTKLPAFAQAHLQSWRHWMCVQAITFDAVPLAEALLARLGTGPSEAMIKEALSVKAWNTLEKLTDMARKSGVHENLAWPGGQYKPSNPSAPIGRSYPHLRSAATLAESVVETVAFSDLPPLEKDRLSRLALAGRFSIPGEVGLSDNFLAIRLARLSGSWSNELSQTIRSTSPVPCHQEMYVLMGHASKEAWTARLEDWQSQPLTDKLASINEFIEKSDIPEIGNKAWPERLGQWLAGLEEKDSKVFLQGHRLYSFKDEVRAHEARIRLDASTKPAPRSPSVRRM